ncbi:flagellar hook-length control protein FliK [Pseudomonas sp. zfem002]|uniref:flagellar hook-length control protein FliK n=1 Tax=Pseudomonas sp. zfem002 TaxID=3078197 RepID=UPI002929DF24|nr:flagellar hook-length control protein FliK [Pseudomonas sp. zfem002]MDU9389206.1 flagellar hook-length control protein FliK [Pseudomonas sp. zfem002]
MPVASNTLLQSGVAAKTARTQNSALDKAQQSLNDKGSDFSRVYAQHSRDKADNKIEAPARERDGVDKPAANNGKADGPEGGKVADGGNDLPDERDVQATDADQGGDSATADADSQSLDANLVAGQLTDAPEGAQLLQAQAEAVAPVLQAASQQAALVTPPASEEQAFDPDSDPLADLPVLRLALEQNAQAQGATSTHAKASTTDTAQGQQPAVNPLAQMLEGAEAEAGQSEGGDKAFASLIDDGLKDTKRAGSDTRVDDFANRLANLTQAVTAKTANAVAPAPLHQPLAMNQSGWSEGLVNRVMYLSSQNLKSADIQLEPKELGRLDIRVNMSADATQITFASGHAGVRDSLESQVPRLRELFSQQGLAQPDVNVADQSRQQHNGNQDDTPKMSGVAGRRNAEGGEGDIAAAAAVETVIGNSTVDYVV